ncbi:probable protein ABIL5 [Telopea speciosissima]|uniref:probable protein ABIL5 n=1 Tax=Telopea speciosissima TaxID=54955 RepID=UPI001CC6DB48|nr:probable protein ABIL5 [Telopea speciosissima]
MVMQMHGIISCGHGSPGEDESDSSDLSRFKKSLQELKDLRSQLHYAADYCERSFLKPNAKKLGMENTKEYICRAVVTVVDHLGSVSTNLEFRLSKSNVVPEVELRIDCLKQRLLACEKYAHKVALTKVCYRADFPRHHSHYIAPSLPNLEKSNDESRIMANHGSEDDYLPLLLYTHAHELPSTTVSSSGFDFSTLVPVQNVPPMPWKPQTPFHFQSTQKLRPKERARKSRHSNDFLFLLRRSKRAMQRTFQ